MRRGSARRGHGAGRGPPAGEADPLRGGPPPVPRRQGAAGRGGGSSPTVSKEKRPCESATCGYGIERLYSLPSRAILYISATYGFSPGVSAPSSTSRAYTLTT